MPIATTAAIGLGVAAGGAFLGAKAQKKAANRAADTSQNVANQNNALAQDIFNQNKATLSPFVNRGNAAGDTINALLGIGGGQQGSPQQQGLPQQQPRANALFNGGFPDAASFQQAGGNPFAQSAGQFAQPNQLSPQQAAEQAFGNFRNSTGFNFRVQQGQDALNSGFAGSGVLQSGAALQDLDQFRQNIASQEFGNFLSQLGAQQGTGLSAAGAQAGVATNFVNQFSQNNNNAGTARANSQLVAGANNPLANIFGTVGGGLLGGAFG